LVDAVPAGESSAIPGSTCVGVLAAVRAGDEQEDVDDGERRDDDDIDGDSGGNEKVKGDCRELAEERGGGSDCLRVNAPG
jgi:hypothetical protein